MENVYLTTKRSEYESLQQSIRSLQDTAAEAKRGLTEDELRSITEMKVTGDKLFTEIEMLSESELRTASVRDMQARVSAAVHGSDGSGNQGKPGAGDDQVRKVGGGTAQERDPGHYRSVKEGGTGSFFADLYRARERGDEQAARRLAEHSRALDTGTDGVGVVAPKWLIEEFAELARQGRVLANLVRNVPLGNDPRPLTLPKQTAGADTEVTEQAAENDPVEDDDAWDSDVDTVTPKPTSGIQVVSRQMLDMASPSIDQLIYGDLIAAYNLKVEKKVGAAIIAVGTALPATSDTEVTDPSHYNRVAVKAAIAVRNARKLPANILAMSVNRWGDFIDLRDTTGRPLVTGAGESPSNVIGGADVGSLDGGRFRGLSLAPTDGIALDDRFAAVRGQDVLLFESSMMRFRYEQPLGPESIKMGIWAYTAVLIRYGTASVKRVEITEES
jgi:HK97 family phage major capsid protein